MAGVQGGKVARAEGATARTNRLLGLLSDFGEAELIMAGCHENVLNMRFRDAGMVRSFVVECKILRSLRHSGIVRAVRTVCKQDA